MRMPSMTLHNAPEQQVYSTLIVHPYRFLSEQAGMMR
jgi:hypothetical protein